MTDTFVQNSIQLWQTEPAKAQSKPTVKARSEGSQAVFEAGSFSWQSDLPRSLGGGNAYPSPTAYLLSALAGCAVVFIRDTLAPQFGVQVDGVSAVVNVKQIRAGSWEWKCDTRSTKPANHGHDPIPRSQNRKYRNYMTSGRKNARSCWVDETSNGEYEV